MNQVEITSSKILTVILRSRTVVSQGIKKVHINAIEPKSIHIFIKCPSREFFTCFSVSIPSLHFCITEMQLIHLNLTFQSRNEKETSFPWDEYEVPFFLKNPRKTVEPSGQPRIPPTLSRDRPEVSHPRNLTLDSV